MANQLIVGLKPGADIWKVVGDVAPRAIPRLISIHHNSYLLALPAGTQASISNALAAHPLVTYVEPNRIRTVNVAPPNDPNYASQWALANIHALQAWSYVPDQYLTAATAGTGRIKVAVLDTGVDCTHPDFMNAAGSSTDAASGGQLLWASSQALIATTLSSPACPWQDDEGHGTHTAGTIAAATGNATGVAAVGYPLELLVYKVLDSTGSGSDSTIASAIEAAADAGARVVSMSLGGTGYSQTLQSAVDYAWQHDTLVVSAAGNTADTSLIYPGAANHALGVAATDSNNVPAYFSTYGNWVKIAAPGVNILSTLPTYTTGIGGTNYGQLSGTSMATPHVAAVAGLVFLANPNLSAAAVAQRLQQSAQTPNTGWDQHIGYGVVNAAAAVTGAAGSAALGSLTGQVVDSTNMPVTGASVSAGSQTFTTAADGLFRIANLTPGTYTLSATASGLSSASMQAAVVPGADTMMAVQMGTAQGEFTGVVTSSGSPVAGATVEAQSGGLVQGTATTDATGTYALYVPAGTYNLTASAPGDTTATVNGQALSAGATMAVNLALSRLGDIAGVTKDSSGTVVPHAQIDVSSGTLTLGTTSDANGNFTSGGVPAGSYTVTGAATGYPNAALTGVAVSPNTTTTVSVVFSVPPPVISGVTASSITSSTAIINWTTSQSADSQVNYGTTNTYGSSSPLNSTLVTSHSVTLSGLSASTTYHYQVLSRNSLGLLSTSSDFSFTTVASTGTQQFLLHLDGSEVTGVTNGSVITAAVAPPGFTGKVSVNGTGSVNYTPAQSGNGAYFLNCCANTNNAYYKFSGSALGSIFSASQGQVTFYLMSRYSWAQRQVSATGARYSFDVRDGNGTHQLYFFTQPSSGYLAFVTNMWGSVQYYYVPKGTEDSLFGNGIILKVSIVWTGGAAKLYLNDALVSSYTYKTATPNWTSTSNLDIGGYEYMTYGGYNTSDDVIDEFSVSGPSGTASPPVVSITAPAAGASFTGTVTVSANATSGVGMAGVQFRLDGANLGTQVSGAGPSYSISWDTTTAANGPHALTAVGTDTAGNSTTSNPVTVTVDAVPPLISMTAPANGAAVSGTVSVSANATDNVGVTGVQFKLDGANLGTVVAGAGSSYSVSWNTTAVANGTHRLSAVATDAAGNTATAASVSVTVNNVDTPPVISAVSATPTASGATITWTTDKASDSQIAYGLTTAYGSTSPLDNTLVTSHSVTLNGLASSTAYHYQVLSRDAAGTLSASSDYTFTTGSSTGLTPVFQLHLDASEVTGVTNGSVITPAVAPAGFTGKVSVNGTGSVNYTPAQSGNGVYFLNCCSNTNNAYYKFTGSAVGNLFSASQGQVTFYLKSRYSWAQRQTSATGARYSFDVRDGNGTHELYFFTQPSAGYLTFATKMWGPVQYYYVPKGTEDTLFGNGVILKISISWNTGIGKLYLNDNLVSTYTYTPATPTWSTISNLDIGGYEYLTYGGYDTLDDVIDEFSVYPTAN